jgi:hypothetical protein
MFPLFVGLNISVLTHERCLGIARSGYHLRRRTSAIESSTDERPKCVTPTVMAVPGPGHLKKVLIDVGSIVLCSYNAPCRPAWRMVRELLGVPRVRRVIA